MDSRKDIRAKCTLGEKRKGPFGMQGRSSSSAGAIYLDRPARIDALRQAVAAARRQVPSIRRAILFGSLASGTATPRSDADILIMVEDSPHKHPRERIPEMLRALS